MRTQNYHHLCICVKNMSSFWQPHSKSKKWLLYFSIIAKNSLAGGVAFAFAYCERTLNVRQWPQSLHYYGHCHNWLMSLYRRWITKQILVDHAPEWFAAQPRDHNSCLTSTIFLFIRKPSSLFLPPKGLSCGHRNTFAYSMQCSGILGVWAMVHIGKFTCNLQMHSTHLQHCVLNASLHAALSVYIFTTQLPTAM